jgi:hypothetical protein
VLVNYQLLQVLPVQLMLAVVVAGHALTQTPALAALVGLVEVEQALLVMALVRLELQILAAAAVVLPPRMVVVIVLVLRLVRAS